MGCWNGTCGLSQLPIHYGDKVKVVLLKKNPVFEEDNNNVGFCYTKDMYEPIYIHLTGYYNDYGYVENLEDENNHHINFINNRILTEENCFENLDLLFESISKGHLPDLYFMLVHSELFDKASKTASNTLINYNDKAEKIKNYLDPVLSKFVDQENRDYYIFNNPYLDNLPFVIKTFFPVNDLKLPNKNDLKDFLLFQMFLSLGRKFWSPQSGAGSQDTDYSVAKLIGNFARKKEKEYLDL